LEKAYMLISCEIGEEQSLYSQLKEIPEIKNCLITFGNYDVVAEFVTNSPSQINEPVTEIIIPKMTIPIPYVIQSGFEYMNDDSGPTIDCPCR
jgi:DNA-binding Lrp family transcriptional regulator